jgi:hypothetical protein
MTPTETRLTDNQRAILAWIHDGQTAPRPVLRRFNSVFNSLDARGLAHWSGAPNYRYELTEAGLAAVSAPADEEEAHHCMTAEDSGIPAAMAVEDPGEGGTGPTSRCAICSKEWRLVGRAGFVYWEPAAEDGLRQLHDPRGEVW